MMAARLFLNFPDNGFLQSGGKTPLLTPPKGGEKTLTLHFVKEKSHSFFQKIFLLFKFLKLYSTTDDTDYRLRVSAKRAPLVF